MEFGLTTKINKMITYDKAWHDRMYNAGLVVAKDPGIETRLMFYINLIMSDPKSFGAPYANARGLLMNAMGFLSEEANHFIQNQITLCHQRSM